MVTQHTGQHGNDCEICNKINRDFARSVNQAQTIAALRQDKAEILMTLKQIMKIITLAKGAETPDNAIVNARFLGDEIIRWQAAIAKATK